MEEVKLYNTKDVKILVDAIAADDFLTTRFDKVQGVSEGTKYCADCWMIEDKAGNLLHKDNCVVMAARRILADMELQETNKEDELLEVIRSNLALVEKRKLWGIPEWASHMAVSTDIINRIVEPALWDNERKCYLCKPIVKGETGWMSFSDDTCKFFPIEEL